SFPSWSRLALRASNGSAFRKACECANQSTQPYRRHRRRSYRRRKDSGGGADANGANLCARRQHGGAGTRHDLVRIDRWAVQFEDDKHLQNADNVVPVIKTAKANADVTALLNEIDGKLTTQDLISLNKSADVDKQDPDVIAKKWLMDHSYATSASGASKGTLNIGALNFPESAIIAQIYGQALKGKGYTVNFKLNLGSREVVE